MTERRVRIVKPWRRSNGQVMSFETLAGYVVNETTHSGGRTTLTLRIPIWPTPHDRLTVPAECVVDAPLGTITQAA